jgi:hypothetical protein
MQLLVLSARHAAREDLLFIYSHHTALAIRRTAGTTEVAEACPNLDLWSDNFEQIETCV